MKKKSKKYNYTFLFPFITFWFLNPFLAPTPELAGRISFQFLLSFAYELIIFRNLRKKHKLDDLAPIASIICFILFFLIFGVDYLFIKIITAFLSIFTVYLNEKFNQTTK